MIQIFFRSEKEVKDRVHASVYFTGKDKEKLNTGAWKTRGGKAIDKARDLHKLRKDENIIYEFEDINHKLKYVSYMEDDSTGKWKRHYVSNGGKNE